jgi:pyruvate kinase
MEQTARTKIVATIGPASDSAERVDALLDAGMSVARVNCAHGTPETLGQMIRTLRRCADARKMPLAILADLGGPKLRIGRFAGGSVQLLPGNRFVLTTDGGEGDAGRVSVNHASLPGDVKPGDAVFLNDGLLRLEVVAVRGNEIETVVKVGGWLSDKKGLSVPAAEISTPSVTGKDWRDLDFLVTQPIDYVSLSFVRSEKDIALLRQGLKERGSELPIVAKIEKAQAVQRLEPVIDAADAVMVARGDLGVECPIADVPLLQKRIIRACLEAAKPVITATQMLESMVGNPRPTRAEASDVANAVLDGTDAVMLSAESATGRYPLEAVRVMREIILNTEEFARRERPRSQGPDRELAVGDAIGRSACLAADSVRATVIVSLTQSGATARYLARWRPRQPILGVTPVRRSWNQLSLVWGVQPVVTEAFDPNFDAACEHIVAHLREERHLSAGAKVVITAGLPFAAHGRTNTIRIETT